MRKLILFLLILTLFISSNILYAQQKYKIIEKNYYLPSLKPSADAISCSYFYSKNMGFKYNFFHIRYGYFNFGIFTGIAYGITKLDKISEPKVGVFYWLPIGIYYPITKKIGFETKSYFLPMKDSYYKYKDIPVINEITLRSDILANIDGVFISVLAGYRFQSNDWKKIEKVAWYSNETNIINYGKFNEIYLEISLGIGRINENRCLKKQEKIKSENPSLKIYPQLTGKTYEIISGESKNLQVQINNNGSGLAEELELKLLTNKFISTSSDRIYIGNLNPHSTRNIEITITAKKVEEKTKVKLSLNLIEKDGFTANDEIEITIQPEIQTERFPPIFSINANLKEPNGNLLLDALEKGEIEITIKNTGRGNAWGLEPQIDIEESNITKHLNFEIDTSTIRKVEPGGSTKIKIPVTADWDVPSGKVKMHILIKEGNGFDSAPVNFSFETQEFLEPKLVITDVGIDDSDSENTFGDGDNKIENMETIEVTAIVQNQGQGKAKDVKAIIKVNDENISFFGDELSSLGDLKSGEFESVKFTILVNNKYTGNSKLPITINITEHYNRYGISNKKLGLELNKITLAAKDINIEGRKHIWQEIQDTPELTVDIEKDFPKTEISRREGIAVIIGNRDYEFYPDNPVEFAINDRNLAERYSKDVFGFRTVLGSENLGFAQFRNFFGTEDNPEGELYRTLRVEEPVFIYVTGHGHSNPQPNQKAKSYIIPKDGNSYDLDATCYPIDILYNNLSYLIENKKPEKLILILDMCFSGYLTTAISSARWESDNPLQDLIDIGNNVGTDVVCIFATQEAQTAKWYQEKKHGLLTYFVLKAFHNSENEGGYKAVYNNDKKLTLGELKRFVLDENYGVPYFANQREVVGNSDLGQQPVIIGDDGIILLEYK